MTIRKAKMFRLNEDGIVPKELSDILQTPEQIDLSKPLMQPYVRKEMAAHPIDIAVIDLQRFYIELMQSDNPWCIFNTIGGLYVAKNSLYAEGEIADNTIKKLKKDYGIELPKVILLEKEPKYFTLVHEYLHLIFNYLPEEKINILLNSMNGNVGLSRALSSTAFNTSYFNWPKEVEEEYFKLWKQGKPTDHLYTLDKLERKDQLQCIDEIIAHFYTTKRPSWQALPSELKTAMKKIGYKTTNLPKVGVEI